MCYYLINLHNCDELVSGGVAGVMGVAGVAVALLQPLREVAVGVEKVDRRESVGRGGGSITTPSRESR